MSVKLATEPHVAYASFLRRRRRRSPGEGSGGGKLPKVHHHQQSGLDQTSSSTSAAESARSKTGWFRWPFSVHQRLEPLREEQQSASSSCRKQSKHHLLHHHNHRQVSDGGGTGHTDDSSDDDEQGTIHILKSDEADTDHRIMMISAAVGSEKRGKRAGSRGGTTGPINSDDSIIVTNGGSAAAAAGAQPSSKSNDTKYVKRRSQPNHHHQLIHHHPHTSKCNDVITTTVHQSSHQHRNKRMSYPPCDTVDLLVHLERLHTKETKNAASKTSSRHHLHHHHDGARLSKDFSTSCPALYNPKSASDRLLSYDSHPRPRAAERRYTPPVPPVNRNFNSEHLKPVKHHAHQRVVDAGLSSEHSNKPPHGSRVTNQTHNAAHAVKQKIRKTKSRDVAVVVPNHTRPQRPKPPSWQDDTNESDTHPPSMTVITEPLLNDATTPASVAQCGGASAPSALVEKDHYASLLKVDSVTIAGSVLDSELGRGGGGSNRRSGLLSSRAHLKRTRSRVIDSREIPKESPVIPLSATQKHEFNLKETHQDNEIYLNENAHRCRRWLAELEVEDLRDQPIRGLKSSADSDETITLDLEVSHDRWNYLGSPYPSDSGSDDD